MKRKTRRKLKNAFLRTATVVAGTVWVLAILGADSNPAWAVTAVYITTAWLTYFGWCNGWFGGGEDGNR